MIASGADPSGCAVCLADGGDDDEDDEDDDDESTDGPGDDGRFPRELREPDPGGTSDIDPMSGVSPE